MSNLHPQPGPGRKARPGKKFYVNLPDDCVDILEAQNQPYTKTIVEAIKFWHQVTTYNNSINK